MKKHVIFTIALLALMANSSFATGDKKLDQNKDTSIQIESSSQTQSTEPFSPISKCSRVSEDGRVAKCVLLNTKKQPIFK